MRAFSRSFLIGLALVFTVSIVGCGGGGGGDSGGTGGGVTSSLVAQSYDEQCAFCHGAGKSQDVANLTLAGMPHSIATGSPQATFTAVREKTPPAVPAGEVRLEVDFRITDSVTGALLTGILPGSISLTLARLDTLLPTSSGVPNWQSYINQGRPTASPLYIRAATEAASTAGGIFTDNLDGTYTYRFSFNMNNRTFPSPPAPAGTPILYDRTATHRIGMQVTGNVANAFVDFVPQDLPAAGTPIPVPAVNRKISINGSAITPSCNSCHVRLGLHGGNRISVEYCVTCHNPGSTDSTSGNTVDFKVMIHKIHRGQDLPIVQAGGSYTIGTSSNYSTVVYPQDIRNCTKCHASSAATLQGDNWKNVPTTASCTSCHDAPVPPVAGFPNLAPADIVAAHVIPEQDAAAKFKYNIISITNTAPGQFPVIRFSVQNPKDPAFILANPTTATYNIRTAPEFKAGSASTLNVLISWDARDYTNTGSLRTPGQPISINALAGAVDNLDGTFTVASTVPIPSTVTGSGAVAIEGHPAVQSVPGGTYDLRVPVTGVVQSFPITDAVAQNRRTVVNIANCNQCHGLLSLHGANRNNNPQLCVICHNANATDINRRPVPGPGVDGKAEEAIDFKSMIHGIHAAKAGTGFDGFRTNGMVVYGFGGAATDFSEVRMPDGAGASTLNRNLNLRNCLGCHSAGTFTVPLTANALPTTITTGGDRSSPDDDVNITPIASVCSSCHDDTASKTHMTANGARFDFKPFVTVVSGGGGSGGGTDQAALCGPGPASSQPAGHTTRTDCCSCHSPR
jgi:hypothetical protein